MAVSPREPTSRPTIAQIERAWRGEPSRAWATDDDGPPPPAPPSVLARRVTWTLAALMTALYVFGVVGFFFPLAPLAMVTALGVANFLAVAIGLRTQRMLGVTFRSRFIARREREPVLYWSSLALIGLWGGFVLWVAWTTMPR